jgi:hypothetical protein
MRQRSTGVDAEVSLAWLLEPLSVETFLAEIWGKDHHHVTSARSFDALLPGPLTVDGLLELFRHEPAGLRLVRGKDKKNRARTVTGWPMALSMSAASAMTLPRATPSSWTAWSNTCGRSEHWPVHSKWS